MSWDYSGDPSKSPKDAVRYLIGDTDGDAHQEVQDEEILWAITQRVSVYGAAADVARAIAAKYTRKVDFAAGDTRKSYSQRAKQFLALSATLDARAFGGAPYAGGISIIDKQNNQLDTDRVNPAFNVGMQDNELPVGAAGNETPGTTSDGGKVPD